MAASSSVRISSPLSAGSSFLPPPCYFSPGLPKIHICRRSLSTKLAATPRMEAQTKFIDFPHASVPVRDLMLDLVDSVETHIGSSLLLCSLPPDVQDFENPTGNARGRLIIRSGVPSSPVDFILGNWVHCKLPSGGALNITSLAAYLKPSTDAPNFILDIIQSSPTSLVVVLDMPPRKDLVLYPEYLKTFYEDTELDRHRQVLGKLPEVTPYIPPLLYIRTFFSPSAILVCIEEEEEAGSADHQTTRVEEIIRELLRPAATEMMKFWLDLCACGGAGREVLGEAEMAYMAKRDQVSRSKTLELELGVSLPRLFGQETAGRVLRALAEAYNA